MLINIFTQVEIIQILAGYKTLFAYALRKIPFFSNHLLEFLLLWR